MKKLLFSFIAFIPFTVFSQSDLKEYYRDEKITINYRFEDCHDTQNGTHKQYVMLKVENLTADPLEVSFTKELWYDGKCTTCESNSAEHNSKFIVKPNTVYESSCVLKIKALQIFSKMLDLKQSELTKFELKNIAVSQIK